MNLYKKDVYEFIFEITKIMQYTSKEVYEYISQQTKDPIVEWKTCEVSGVQFPIYQSDLAFYDKISPVINGVKYQIPTPKLCPEERERQRLMFRNERNLYRNKCKATGKDIISIHSQDKAYPVFSKEYRRSDARNPLDYGLPFNSQLSFFEQFRNLHYRVPKLALSLMKNENVDYGNDIEQAKNCYMTFNSCDIEEVYYSSAVREQAK